MFKVLKKLKLLKSPLRRLKSSYGNLADKIKLLKQELDSVQLLCDADPFNQLLHEDLCHLRLAYVNACHDEEVVVRQRAKDVNGNGGDFSVKRVYYSMDGVYDGVTWAKTGRLKRVVADNREEKSPDFVVEEPCRVVDVIVAAAADGIGPLSAYFFGLPLFRFTTYLPLTLIHAVTGNA
ncbi:hypothetical protein L6452_15239 [Arctium lappa]|uniref:Uncharacterized protein n=1 Tax=Arctium lappa TaxID=4217 RepID=A0ACB9CN68_ARCLA|nr:hypothetical protein L6452_15239 [Arctium lappa]